jgi:CO dehydrogenase/acetyl-CoA synthase beta subunit
LALFDKHHNDIINFLDHHKARGGLTVYRHMAAHSAAPWPIDKNRNMVMAGDTAVELGNPKDASVSFLYWVDDPTRLHHGRISVVGPDIPDSIGKRLSYGKIVIIGGTGFDAENSFDRYREMELLRYDMHLKGYMMRAVSRYGQEWSRVSREAVDKGFSFAVLGAAIIDQYMKLDYVSSVEVIFVTAGRDELTSLHKTSEGVSTIIGAMNKMAGELSFDCDSCEYTEVCGDVAELRSMRRALQEKEKRPHA